MDNYMTIGEAAEIWNVSERRVRMMCAQGSIEGAIKFGGNWAIPRDAKKPADHRTMQFRNYAT